MRISNKVLIAVGICLLVLYGIFLALFLINLSDWKDNLSKEYLNKAKKEQSIDKKLAYYEFSLLLAPSKEATLGAGLAAVERKDNALIEKYLPKLSNLDEWMQVADTLNVSRETFGPDRIDQLENALIAQGYPQSVYKLLEVADEEKALSRNGLIELANRQYIESKYEQSYTALLEAKEIDPYYPQTFQQLVKVCEKLNRTDEAQSYQSFLNSITF